jgi:broad specificity phosphatase PhoE
VNVVSANRTTLHPLVLVRHGESNWNELKLVQGQNNEATLNDRGREQAREAALRLRNQDFDAIMSSDLARTLETAQIIAPEIELTIMTTSALRERSFGDFEGRPLGEMTPSLSGIENHVVVDDKAHPKNGESLLELWLRVGSFVESLREQRRDQRLLLVTHGGTIHALRAYCAGEAPLHHYWYRVENCSVWTVE